MSEKKHNRREFLATSTALTAAVVGSIGHVGSVAARETSQSDTPIVDCDFPGGNVIFERIEGDSVYLRQDPRDTSGFWFYWCFRVRGAAGRSLAFNFTGGNVLGVRGPAVSTDGGKRWAWLGAESMQGASFTYRFPDDAGDVRFCLAMPYQEANLQEFLDRHAGNPHLKVEQHSTTKKGRKTERLRLGCLDAEPEHRVLLTCRHHCCEMMAGWALEGILEAVLADSPDGRWFRERVQIAAIPFMDKDGVEDGDQGKNRKPHDHNRDYQGESIYPSVAALKEFVPRWSQGRLRLGVDMHCPYIRGGGNEQVFIVGNPSPEARQQQERFSSILQQEQTGPLVHDPKYNIPWGQSWNTLKEPRSSSRWMSLLPGIWLGTSIEIPYANVAGRVVTIETARALGNDLARAIRQYLQTHSG